MQINRPAAEGLALVDRSTPNGRELMHIKVATLGAETRNILIVVRSRTVRPTQKTL